MFKPLTLSARLHRVCCSGVVDLGVLGVLSCPQPPAAWFHFYSRRRKGAAAVLVPLGENV